MPRTNATTPVGVKQLREPIGAERERARKLPIRELAYLVLKLNVVRQLAFAAILTSALFVSGAQLSATGCPVASAPIAKACQMGCCANKACCKTSHERTGPPAQPLVKAGAAQQNMSAMPAAIAVALVTPVATARLHVFSSADGPAHSPPPLALTCIRLI